MIAEPRQDFAEEMQAFGDYFRFRVKLGYVTQGASTQRKCTQVEEGKSADNCAS